MCDLAQNPREIGSNKVPKINNVIQNDEKESPIQNHFLIDNTGNSVGEFDEALPQSHPLVWCNLQTHRTDRIHIFALVHESDPLSLCFLGR